MYIALSLLSLIAFLTESSFFQVCFVLANGKALLTVIAKIILLMVWSTLPVCMLEAAVVCATKLKNLFVVGCLL